jgi:pimeloyl-ACP methyl ester carboxylesterase
MRAVHLAAVLAGVSLLALVAADAAAGDFHNPKADKPPQAAPQRRSAAEGVPPLPLPATPLRRSEKKREPAPPALVGLINFSTQAAVAADGKRSEAPTFPTTQLDIERLINFANSTLNIKYRYVDTNFASFSWDPTELPVLYITGWTPMPQLSDQTIEKLRRYLYDGGTMVMHAQCGRPEFTETARREIARILPNRQLAMLDTDSPVFSAYYKIETMRFRKDKDEFKTTPPLLEGVYLGSRPALILSPIDLNCGWDVAANPIEGGVLYHQDDAIKLGVNIITSVLADFQYARAWGTEKIYHQQGENTRDQLVIGQIVHAGDWDPTPHALPNLMKYIAKNTTLSVQFKREAVDLAAADAFKHPVLYITGMRDFKFSDEEVKRLAAYLAAGGVLVADPAAGNRAFDAAFRREIKRVLPKDELKSLPADSPLYQLPYAIRTVEYTSLVKAQEPKLNAPTLEGITIDGQLAVIYSPLSMASGWEQLGFAYNRGYSDADAIRLGVNVLSYALTH